MRELRINTKESEYKGVPIYLDDVRYEIRYPITVKTMEDVDKFAKEAKAGKLDALANQVAILTTIPFEIASKRDVRETEKILKFVTAGIEHPESAENNETKDEQDSKNVEGPSEQS